MARRSVRYALSLMSVVMACQASAQTDRTVLPVPEQPFTGTIKEYVEDSTPAAAPAVKAPAGAPNVIVLMSDDVGFSTASTFGGPIPTPTMDRLAAEGVRYNRFHTTGICSPSRAALLTGRNHHVAGQGFLGESAFPSYSGRIRASTATIAQTLRLNGYATAMFGKHHNVPYEDSTPVGRFDYWPTGLGFDYFFGFIGGYDDQYRTSVYRGTNRLPEPDKAELLEKRMADDAINWIHRQKAAAPDRPFFIYYAPASAHSPLQAPADYINRFRGKFDAGWDKIREETYRRQLRQGIIPAGTKLVPRPDYIPAWSSLPPEQKALFARLMEVAAGMLAYQDEQVGRIFAELERMGELDNTLVMFVQGDNGASGESGNAGAVNEMYGTSFGAPIPETITPKLLAELGGPSTHPAYPAGWAWAMNAPYPGMKQYASLLGGIRNDMIMAWPGKVHPKPGTVCAQFGHLVDIAPTVLDAAGLPAPKSVYGVAQKPFDGVSLLDSLSNCQPDKPRTQYFELTGKVGLYSDGWFLSGEDGRKPWDFLPPGGGHGKTTWSLYDLRSDFSQSTDLSAKQPQKLKSMMALWESEARRNDVYPLNHAFSYARYASLLQSMAKVMPPPIEAWGKNVSVPVSRIPANRSFNLSTQVTLQSSSADGVIAAVGAHFSGWSLFLDKGRPTFVYALSPQAQDSYRFSAKDSLGAGTHSIQLDFEVDQASKSAKVELRDDNGRVLFQGSLPRTYPMQFATETLDVGADLGVPVTEYSKTAGPLAGDLSHLLITFR